MATASGDSLEENGGWWRPPRALPRLAPEPRRRAGQQGRAGRSGLRDGLGGRGDCERRLVLVDRRRPAATARHHQHEHRHDDPPPHCPPPPRAKRIARGDRKSTRLNSSHVAISYAVFCLKKKKT